MQIHEVSRPELLLQEAFIDYVKAAVSKDPNISRIPRTPQGLAQRAQYISNNKAIDLMAQNAKRVWDQRVLQLQRTNANRPLDSQRYANELRTFTIKTLLNNREPSQMINGAQIDQIIQRISNPATRNNPAMVTQLFNQLVDQAAVAAVSFEDPALAAARTATPAQSAVTATAQSPAATQPAATQPAATQPAPVQPAAAKPTIAAQVAGKDVRAMARSAGVDLDRLKLLGSMMQSANNIKMANRTGNDQLDTLLTLLGYRLS